MGRFFDIRFPGVGADVQSALERGAAEVDERLAQGVSGRARRFRHREGGQVPDSVPGCEPGVLLECMSEEVRVGGEGTRGVRGRAQLRFAASAVMGEPAFGHEAFDAQSHLLVAHPQGVGDGVQLVRADGAVFADQGVDEHTGGNLDVVGHGVHSPLGPFASTGRRMVVTAPNPSSPRR